MQIHSLEIQLLTRYVGELIGSKIGRVLEVVCSSNSIAWGECLHVRVLINVTKPLVRGSRIDFNGMVSVVVFCYEKLGDFCFICGILDHLDRDCPNLYTNEIDAVRKKRQFDSWLRADGMRSVSIDELSRGIKNRNKRGELGQDMETEGNTVLSVGEGLTMQVMQYGSNMDFMLEEMQKAWVPLTGDQSSTGSLECIVQGSSTDMG